MYWFARGNNGREYGNHIVHIAGEDLADVLNILCDNLRSTARLLKQDGIWFKYIRIETGNINEVRNLNQEGS